MQKWQKNKREREREKQMRESILKIREIVYCRLSTLIKILSILSILSIPPAEKFVLP